MNTDLSPTARNWQIKLASGIIPGYCDPGLVYDQRLKDNYCRSQLWVDAGCGHNHDILMADDFKGLSLGFDLGDRQIKRYLRADIYRQPFKASSLDFISCRWVFEHLREPEAALEEFLRVLKPGSRLLIRTTNRRHYISIISRILPMPIKYKLAKSEIFPTYFIFNDNQVFKRFFANHSEWKIHRIEYIENLHYGNPLAFVFSVFSDKVLNILGLFYLKSTIILELAKK